MVNGLGKKLEVPFTIASNNIKYLVHNSNQAIRHLHDEKLTSLKKEINEDIRQWKNLPYSWICKIDVIKMAILTKATYRFSEIPIKIQTLFCTDLERKILSIIWNNTSKIRIAKTILKSRRTVGPITISHFRLNYRNKHVHTWNWRFKHKFTYLGTPDILKKKSEYTVEI